MVAIELLAVVLLPSSLLNAVKGAGRLDNGVKCQVYVLFRA